ncbi:hypothetical protein Ga0074812_107245 [Parafrankia irregularis]|uniref:Uncharacterized protein n=1 Tax=Parafrankia irregularis TaxID=795642 RepID=A0A0S4QM93_9ACTN|nr:hypothetical protein Ga0074812_107245 [Parafrankia irregularis]
MGGGIARGVSGGDDTVADAATVPAWAGDRWLSGRPVEPLNRRVTSTGNDMPST